MEKYLLSTQGLTKQYGRQKAVAPSVRIVEPFRPRLHAVILLPAEKSLQKSKRKSLPCIHTQGFIPRYSIRNNSA